MDSTNLLPGVRLGREDSDLAVNTAPRFHASLALPPSRRSHILDAPSPMKYAANGTPKASTGTDSGYASKTTTPDSSHDISPGKGNFPTSLFDKLIRPKAPPLYEYDKEIPDAVQKRFRDLVEFIEDPLFKYLHRDQSRRRRLSIKLKVVGVAETTAKPCIVVLCQSTDRKMLIQFFKQPYIREQLRLRDGLDGGGSPLCLVICDKPPRPTAMEVYVISCECEQLGPHSHGGACIRTEYRIPYHKTRARIGGAISVQQRDGSTNIYGMTVGHVFERDSFSPTTTPPKEADYCALSESCDGGDGAGCIDQGCTNDGGYFFVDENDVEYDIDGYSPQDDASTLRDQNRLKQSIEDLFESRTTGMEAIWTKLGSGPAQEHFQTDADIIDLDFALVELDDPSKFVQGGAVDLSVGEEFPSSGGGLQVHIATSGLDSRSIPGVLRQSSSYLLIGSNEKFVSTYLFSPHDKTDGVQMGDSGAWVIDPITDTVWGHVVAKDNSGDAYVIPLAASLKQICQRFDALKATITSNRQIEHLASKKQHMPQNLAHFRPAQDFAERSENIRFSENDESEPAPSTPHSPKPIEPNLPATPAPSGCDSGYASGIQSAQESPAKVEPNDSGAGINSFANNTINAYLDGLSDVQQFQRQNVAGTLASSKRMTEVDREIARLEQQVLTGKMKLRDEKATNAKITSLRRQRKVLPH